MHTAVVSYLFRQAHLSFLLGLATSLLIFCAGQASGLEFLQDGNGYWWDFLANGAVEDGRSPTGAADSVDAFDSAMRLAVNGETFPDAPQRYELSGRMLVTGPSILAGLSVTRCAYVPDTAGAGWACFLEYLENATDTPVVVTVRILGNLGSDGDTAPTASSSGDAAFTAADRWVASDDSNNGGGDPSLNFNYWGAGAANPPSAVYLPASQEDYYVDFPNVNVPARSRIALIHFCGQNADDAAAAANAAALDALPAAALAALDADRVPVVNWGVASDALAVSPGDTFTVSGQQGGPFTPDARSYTLENTGAASLAWSSSGPAWATVTPASGAALGAGASIPVEIALNSGADALASGSYLEAVTFTNNDTGIQFRRYIQMVIGERLVIEEEAGYSAEGFQGGSFSPASTTYTLRNAGTPESLEWTITAPAWLTATPADSAAAGGALAPGAMIEVTIAPNSAADALAPGVHTDTLTFTNTSFGTSLTRGVSLTVEERLSVTPDAVFVMRGLAGGPFSPTATLYTLTNLADDASLSWSIAPGSIPGWLSISPATSGLLAAGASYQLVMQPSASASSEVIGDHLAQLLFQNTNYGTDQTREIYLRVKDVVYVDASVAGGDGSSWAAALNSVQAGIDAADASDSWVWVADGVYPENVTMAEGVELYGGFAGGETTLAARNVAANIAAIDGQGLGRVVTFGAIRLAGLDGFTLMNGHGDANGGGGVRCDGCDATAFLKNCAIRNNQSLGRGAGIHCVNGAALEISGCTIAGNALEDIAGRDFGGGIGCTQSSPTIKNSWICNNGSRYGAGLGCVQASPVVTDCILSGNVASNATINPSTGQPNGAGGGAVFAHDHSNPVLTNCILSGNYTQNWGAGALYCQGSAEPVLTNCTITDNRSYNTAGYEIQSGIVVNTGSAPTLVNCILAGMTYTAAYEEDVWPDLSGNLTNIVVRNCLFADNGTADFRDMATGTGAYYTGGQNINAGVNGALDNVYGNPAPQFLPPVTGAWSAAPAYDAASNTTTLTADGTPFASMNLKGRLLNADTAQNRHALVLANTSSALTVSGDIRSGSPFGYADLGDAFAVLDYHLEGYSPAVDVGDTNAVDIYGRDLGNGSRVVGGIVDLGVYECGAASVAAVTSITALGGPVVNGDTVQFVVLFSRGVTGVDLSDFVLTGLDGQAGATITGLSGEDYYWIVTVDAGDANGALELNFIDIDGSVTDVLGLNPIADYTGGPGAYVDFLRITTQPEGGSREPGDSFTFFVQADDGTGQLHYVWKKDGEAAPNAADNPYLLYESLTLEHSGSYTCEVSDDYTTVVSNAAELSVQPAMPVSGVLSMALLALLLAGCSFRYGRRASA